MCHHSFRFDDNDFRFFAHQQKETLFDERWAANSNSNPSCNRNCRKPKADDWKTDLKREGNRIVQSLMSQLKETGSLVSEITQHDTTPPGLPSPVMGGRNSHNKRNKGGRAG